MRQDRVLLGVGLLGASALAARNAGSPLDVGVEVVVGAAVLGLLVGVALRVADRVRVPPAAVPPMPDGTRDEALRAAARVRAASRSRHGLHTQLLPELRLVVDDHLRHHGVDPEDDRGSRRVLGDELHELVRSARSPGTDREAPGLPVPDLLDHLRRLEAP